MGTTLSGLDLSRGVSPGELNILVSSNGGSLKGNVRDEGGASPGGVQVLAVPASGGHRRPKAVLTDQKGLFEMKGMAPGEYRVLAFEDLEPGAMEDPEFLKRFAAKSKKVEIKEQRTETVEAPVISAAAARAWQ